MTARINSGLKNPMPQRPMTRKCTSPFEQRPERLADLQAARRRSRNEPGDLPSSAFTTFRLFQTHWRRRRGRLETRRSRTSSATRLPLKLDISSQQREGDQAAVTLPTAESACNKPRECGRAASGRESATSARKAEHAADTEAVDEAVKGEVKNPVENAESPVQTNTLGP